MGSARRSSRRRFAAALLLVAATSGGCEGIRPFSWRWPTLQRLPDRDSRTVPEKWLLQPGSNQCLQQPWSNRPECCDHERDRDALQELEKERANNEAAYLSQHPGARAP